MRPHERTVRAACLAVAISIAASIATASIFMLLRRQQHPMGGVTLEKIGMPSRAAIALQPLASRERDLLGLAVRDERQRQGLEVMERRGAQQWQWNERDVRR